MALLIAITGWNPDGWLARFRAASPGMAIVDARETFDPVAITHAAVWKPKRGLLSSLPNLRAVFNLGAGVDALLQDSTLPDIPLFRITNDDMTGRMSEWVALQVLHHFRQMPDYQADQRARLWHPRDQPAAHQLRVGIMGMGVLGRDAARVLRAIGFEVAGWSRSRREEPGVAMFAGVEELPAFLGRTDILVVLLPLTDETQGILNQDLFCQLARDGALGAPVLINAGRGGLQNEADVLAGLEDGTLRGASLDVFETEPLASGSSLWTHPRLVITPHVAADSTPEALVEGVFRDIAAFERGESLPNRVDRHMGY